MNRCPECKTLVLGGGYRIPGEKPYCKKACAEASIVRRFADTIPEKFVREEAGLVRAGACPICGSTDGSVNGRLVHSVISLVRVTFWRHDAVVGCRRCHRKKLAGKTLTTLLLGWWSVHGIFMTPVFLVKNAIEWFRKDPEGVSDVLLRQVHRDLVLKLAREPVQAQAVGAEAATPANSRA
jgi:hypothetical protein